MWLNWKASVNVALRDVLTQSSIYLQACVVRVEPRHKTVPGPANEHRYGIHSSSQPRANSTESSHD